MKVVFLAKIVMEFNKIKKNLQDLNLKPRYSLGKQIYSKSLGSSI